MNELKWTTETPTKPGWYWVVEKSEYGLKPFVKLLDVEIDNNQNPYYNECNNYVWGGVDYIVDFSKFAYFMGPIEPPEMPAVTGGEK